MGDGKAYDRMEEQTDITCGACHAPRFETVTDKDQPALRLARLNRKVPDPLGGRIAVSRKGTPLYNVQEVGEKVFFFGKQDGRAIEMDISSPEKPHHRMKGHDRLSCQSCHSAWMPQCYGCHLTVRKGEKQRDWFTGEERPGLWRESRSYMRFSKPLLGLENPSSVSPFSPCQIFVSSYDDMGRYRPDQSFKLLTMSSFDPHTTAKGSRTCRDCHGDPKSLGLGEGRLFRDIGEWRFRPTYDADSAGLGMSSPMDAFVDLNGRPLHRTSREGARPFDRGELEKILRVNACIGCHDRYEDPVYTDFQKSLDRFQEERDLPCRSGQGDRP
jgi:cytochrome c553